MPIQDVNSPQTPQPMEKPERKSGFFKTILSIFSGNPKISKTEQTRVTSQIQEPRTDSSLNLRNLDNSISPQSNLPNILGQGAETGLKTTSKRLQETGKTGHIDNHVITKESQSIGKLAQVTCELLDPTEKLDPETNVRLNQAKPSKDTGKEITQEKIHNGTTYGKEIITRKDTNQTSVASLKQTLNMLKEQLESKKSALEALKESEAPQAHQDKVKNTIQELEVKCAFCEKQIASIQKYMSTSEKPDWNDSNYFRGELRKDPTNFSEINDRSVPTSPINCRYQKVVDTEGNKIGGFARLGVISDLRNGFVSLPELQKLKNNPDELTKKLKELETLQKKYEKKGETTKAEAVKYAIDQLKPENIDKTIVERTFILKQQMLQLIELQVSENPSAINKNCFSIVHELLLNPTTNKVDKTGWCHNEANQTLDMQAAFELFKKTQIVFSNDPTTPPHFDENGAMVMARPPGVRKDLESTHIQDAFILNNSPQGHTKNDGIQKEINDKSIPQLESLIKNQVKAGIIDQSQANKAQKKLDDLKKIYAQNNSNYDSAVLLAEVLSLAKIPHSMGCLSAKDRTGFTGAQAICNIMKNSLESLPDEATKFFLGDVLNPLNPATLVAIDNVAQKYLKLSAAFLPHISDVVRAVYASTQLKGTLAGKV